MTGVGHFEWSGVYPLSEKEGAAALRRLSYRFAADVLPNTTIKLTRKVPADGTVEKVRIRTYVGNELALQIRPWVESERGRIRHLVTYAPAPAKQYVDGDDETWVFEIREPVEQNGDCLVVEVVNTSINYTYSMAVDIEVDHAGGVWPFYVIAGGGQ
jgi:hypothetical protein